MAIGQSWTATAYIVGTFTARPEKHREISLDYPISFDLEQYDIALIFKAATFLSLIRQSVVLKLPLSSL